MALLDRGRECGQSGYVTVPEDDLSPREVELLRLIARGLDSDEVAAELSMSTRVAQGHVSSILSKLMKDLSSRVALREADAQAHGHPARRLSGIS
jgi:DNA-binding NarL/FixJ family response regulator